MICRISFVGLLVCLPGCADSIPVAASQVLISDDSEAASQSPNASSSSDRAGGKTSTPRDSRPQDEGLDPEAENDLEAFRATADQLEAKETKAGQMVADRELARALVEYGERTQTPEAILLGVQILHRNQVAPVLQEEVPEREQLENLLNVALEMRPEDELLLQMAERVADFLEEETRGLAGGPKQWPVTIDKGDYFQLDPRLVYNAQEKAVVTAYSTDPKAIMGATIRRGDQRRVAKRATGRGTVKIEWNSGIHTTGWDCRIYNITGEDGLVVRIETN